MTKGKHLSEKLRVNMIIVIRVSLRQVVPDRPVRVSFRFVDCVERKATVCAFANRYLLAETEATPELLLDRTKR